MFRIRIGIMQIRQDKIIRNKRKKWRNFMFEEISVGLERLFFCHKNLVLNPDQYLATPGSGSGFSESGCETLSELVPGNKFLWDKCMKLNFYTWVGFSSLMNAVTDTDPFPRNQKPRARHQSPNFKTLKEPKKRFQGTNSAGVAWRAGTTTLFLLSS